jgi:uncharacterized protein YdhG (YjbR/CyaY superfamily)
MNDHFDQLEKAAPSVRAAYAAILKASRAMGKMREDPKKTSIHLMRETAFAGIVFQREALILTVKSSDPIDSERVRRAQRMSAQRWSNEVRVASPREVDKELRDWLAGSYALAGTPRKRPTMPSGHSNIDEYLAQVTPAKRAALVELRKAIHAAVPGSEECISYQMPAFRKDGKVFICIAAMANHISLFPGPAPIKKFSRELKDYETSKGTVRLPLVKPMPVSLVKKLVVAALAERSAGKKTTAPSKKRRVGAH